MLWTVLPTSVVEALANHLLSLDANTTERLQKVAGKRLRVTLTELGKPLTIEATATGVLMSWVDQEAVDCHIITRLAVLPELRDTANITRLIKADALDIEGDPILAQQFSRLFVELDIDWGEQLSERLGDVPAHFIMQAFQRSKTWLKQTNIDQQQWVRDALVEEKQILISDDEFAAFKESIQQLRAQIDRLERRLKTRDAL